MKKFLLTLVISFMCSTVYAGQLCVDTTPAQEKAVSAQVFDPQIWLQKAWIGKAYNSTMKVIMREGGLNAIDMSAGGELIESQSEDWILTHSFPSRVEREAQRQAIENARNIEILAAREAAKAAAAEAAEVTE